LPDEQAPALQGIPYRPGRLRTERLPGGTEGLQGLPHETPMCGKYKIQKIIGTVYDEQYPRAYGRQRSERGKQMKKLRQSTVEPVFGSPAQFCGPRKIGVPGKAGAQKVMLMAAIAFNLKKYLKKGGRKPSTGIFRTIMDALQSYLTIFCQQIRSRPVLLMAL